MTTDAHIPKDQCDTPRTDEAERVRENGGDVSDIFKAMRQLERELNEAKSLNATLEAKLKRAEKTIDDLNDRFIEDNI
jgi:septal ring factor EnvC (AmiA/AmiB activator)